MGVRAGIAGLDLASDEVWGLIGWTYGEPLW